MKDFTKQTERELASLSHALAGHMRRLDSLLGRGAHSKLKSPRTPHALRHSSSKTTSNQLLGTLTHGAGKLLGRGNDLGGAANASGTSQGQMWSDIASLIQKSILRDL